VEQEKVTYFLAVYGRYYPEEKIPEIIDKLKALPEDSFEKLNAAQKKDPLSILSYSLFMGYFGIDRMAIGEIVKGLLKMAIMVVMCTVAYFGIDRLSVGETAKTVLTVIAYGIALLWPVIDWFRIEKATKEHNYKKLSQIM